MKSLLDIQQDIRNLESSVKEITESIRSIHSDIEEIRGSSDSVELDYKQIEILAGQLPFGKHPLDKLEDGRSCQFYLEMLLNIVRLDLEGEDTVNRLVFIQWLQIQSRINWSLEELYMDCFTRSKELHYEFAEAVDTKYRRYFMLDALIVANMGGKANREVLEYIVDLSRILGITKDNLQTASLIARIVLCQNADGIARAYLAEVYGELKKYRFYINMDIIKSVKLALRDIVVALWDNETIEFRWKVRQLSRVEKGDLIATYERKMDEKELVKKKEKGIRRVGGTEFKEIRATSSGMIFQFRDNNTNYGVIAHETDNKDSIKAWVKANRRQTS